MILVWVENFSALAHISCNDIDKHSIFLKIDAYLYIRLQIRYTQHHSIIDIFHYGVLLRKLAFRWQVIGLS